MNLGEILNLATLFAPMVRADQPPPCYPYSAEDEFSPSFCCHVFKVFLFKRFGAPDGFTFNYLMNRLIIHPAFNLEWNGDLYYKFFTKNIGNFSK